MRHALIALIIIILSALNSEAQSMSSRKNYNTSELRLSRDFEGETVDFTKKYMVSKDFSVFKLQIRGVVDKGVITIVLTKPDGEQFKTIDVDPASDVRYTQTVDLRTEPEKYAGEWQIRIKTDNAEGSYSLTLYVR